MDGEMLRALREGEAEELETEVGPGKTLRMTSTPNHKGVRGMGVNAQLLHAKLPMVFQPLPDESMAMDTWLQTLHYSAGPILCALEAIDDIVAMGSELYSRFVGPFVGTEGLGTMLHSYDLDRTAERIGFLLGTTKPPLCLLSSKDREMKDDPLYKLNLYLVSGGPHKMVARALVVKGVCCHGGRNQSLLYRAARGPHVPINMVNWP